MPKKSSVELMIENLSEKIGAHIALHKEDKEESRQWKSEFGTKIDKLVNASIEQGVAIKSLNESKASTEHMLIEHGKMLGQLETITSRMESDIYNTENGMKKRQNELWDMKSQFKPIIWVLGVVVVALIGGIVDRITQNRNIQSYESDN